MPDYNYERIDRGIKDKIIAEIKKNKEELVQAPIEIDTNKWLNLDISEDENEQRIFINEHPNLMAYFPGNNGKISLSRDDVENTKNTEAKILKTLMWGYRIPSNLRGYAKSILRDIARLAGIFDKFKKNKDLDLGSQEELLGVFTCKKSCMSNIIDLDLGSQEELLGELKTTRGLGDNGIATKSKLLYFFNFSFDGKRCLIYDSNVQRFLNHDDGKITVCSDCYKEYLNLKEWAEETGNKDSVNGLNGRVREIKWDNNCYYNYLGLMNDLKNDPDLKKIFGNDEKIDEKIEYFMFKKGKELGNVQE